MESLEKLLWLLLLTPIVFILARPMFYMRWFRFSVIILHTLCLTFFTIFVFNRPTWRWAGQEEVVRNLSQPMREEAYAYIRNNFVFVDNSFDKILLPNPEGDVNDSTSVAITNRKAIVSFLKVINERRFLADLVIIDVGFYLETPDDSALGYELTKLEKSGKIILSIDPTDKESIRLLKNPLVYGNVSEKGNENSFVSHKIMAEDYESLAYKVYCKMNGVNAGKQFFKKQLFWEFDTKGKRHLALNLFFPEFYLKNEDSLRGSYQGSENENDSSMVGYEGNRNYFILSETLSKYGKDEFVESLKQRKRAGLKNNIFLGSFASRESDVHQTLYGSFHGTTILLNIIYALKKERHYLRWGLIALLFVLYLIINGVLVYRSLHLSILHDLGFAGKKHSAKAKKLPKAAATKRAIVIEWVRQFLGFILDFVFVEEVAFTLLITSFFLVKFLTGYFLNILSLFIYLAVIRMGLAYARKEIIK